LYRLVIIENGIDIEDEYSCGWFQLQRRKQELLVFPDAHAFGPLQGDDCELGLGEDLLHKNY
jgi:hypothetical protein